MNSLLPECNTEQICCQSVITAEVNYYGGIASCPANTQQVGCDVSIDCTDPANFQEPDCNTPQICCVQISTNTYEYWGTTCGAGWVNTGMGAALCGRPDIGGGRNNNDKKH
eukprot:CAMPEP_0202864932 /NCGR_PEP_ID=MMETSP1391-20130828/4965_1 /ASSEMBLY_ACC=CAM_ASM_000867 /TAXON_ID=1034604 /ORGANISM="Chlamydomonas leiostraca, Strain SAG 11-49" /LENGTH=110 /DNA_ID=CAMNT_0049544709 /DNA_START=55 /DNA_END=387 /DNA_ORIENTATION=+